MKLELLRAIITNECQLRSFSFENISLACCGADTHFNEGNTFVSSINFGIRLAETLSDD